MHDPRQIAAAHRDALQAAAAAAPGGSSREAAFLSLARSWGYAADHALEGLEAHRASLLALMDADTFATLELASQVERVAVFLEGARAHDGHSLAVAAVVAVER